MSDKNVRCYVFLVSVRHIFPYALLLSFCIQPSQCIYHFHHALNEYGGCGDWGEQEILFVIVLHYYYVHVHSNSSISLDMTRMLLVCFTLGVILLFSTVSTVVA